MVWVGLGWFRVSPAHILFFHFALGILVWEHHSVALEGVGLGLVWLGLGVVLFGFLSKSMLLNNMLIYEHTSVALKGIGLGLVWLGLWFVLLGILHAVGLAWFMVLFVWDS